MTSAALDPVPLPPRTSVPRPPARFLDVGLLRFNSFLPVPLNEYTVTTSDNVVTTLRPPPNRISCFTSVRERR